MTLQVPFDDFVDAAFRITGTREAYLARSARRTVVTAATRNKVVVASTRLSMEATKRALETAGATVHPGVWSFDGDLADEVEAETHPYIVAVSYQSSGDKPGIWVDAFESQPTEVQALQAMFDEFVETGQVARVSLDAFLKVANANVVISSPTEVANWVRQKRLD